MVNASMVCGRVIEMQGLTPNGHLEPTLFDISYPSDSVVGQHLFSNSISLTVLSRAGMNTTSLEIEFEFSQEGRSIIGRRRITRDY
jgi:hypothetical protein